MLIKPSRLREIERDRLDIVLSEMREGYAEMDEDLHFVLVNRAAEKILGAPASRILGRTPRDLFGVAAATPLEMKLRQILKARDASQFEQDLGLESGPVSLRVRCDGNGLVLFFDDIALLRSMEHALREESARRNLIEERFETALSVNQIVVFKLDRELRYSWVYNNQIGMKDYNVVGETPEHLFEPDSARRLMTFFRSVLASGQAQRTELALRPRQETEERHFVSSARPIFNDQQEIIGLTGASIEITSVVRQREELARAREEAFIAKAEAERASLSKSKFLAAASHDLRQPVQSLLLLIEVMKSRLTDAPSQKVVDQMEKAVDALRLLFDSMLDISRLDAGVIVPALQTVCLNTLVGRLADEYRLRAEHRSLDFRVVPTSAYVRTDPVLVERVLRNLLENALRYCPTGRILIGCRRQSKMMRIDVIDTGIGIAPNHLEEIFEEFHQVANAARDRSQGLGLGLSIVKKVMRLLGGTVFVRSALGQGSCFSVTLPLVNQHQGNGHLTAGDTEKRNGHMVLVVEDDGLLRDSLDIMLRSWGYQTMTARTGEEALSIIEKHSLPDIVISDYRLSAGLTGIDTVLKINEAAGRHLPSVIITGDTAPERVREVHGSGLRILHKPVAADELRRALLGMSQQQAVPPV
ncbi:hypothetical protein CWS72_25175 [Telmatospirillum siberiense]|uniref:histidine kinase n=1 Tax=Telmatospirillum siberiense TaxID=382514 RepID=A0A2N3PMV4_9PROT|nr:hypothetical protein CWS72_25175 [Telmatospirillum siberiense]